MNKNVSLAIKKAVSNLNRIEESNLKELNNKKPDLFSLNDQTELFQNDKGISLNPILNSFQKTVNKYNVDKSLIDAFLKSMEQDLEIKI